LESIDNHPPVVREPRRIINAPGGIGLIEFIDQNLDALEDDLIEHGAVLLRGFDPIGAHGLERLVQDTYGQLLEYIERATRRHQVQGLVYTSTDSSPRHPIPLHNENSFASRWPGRIFFYCVQPPDEGGRTPISDIADVYQRIDPQIHKRFEEHGVMYQRFFDTGPGMSWQEVFSTPSKAQFEQQCRHDGIHFQWLENDCLRTRQVRPAVARHPKTQQPVWFNHAMTLHYTSLDSQLAQTMLQQLGEEKLPHNTYYGDGSPIEKQTLDHIRTAYGDASFLFDWQAGDLLLLDNMRMAHGREPYSGQRQIVAAMAEPLTWSNIDGGSGLVESIAAPDVQSNNTEKPVDPPDGSNTAQPPRNENERLLADAIAQTLELNSVGVHDDLFDLGIDSIVITRVINQIQADRGVTLPMRAFFDTPTIAQIAPLLDT